MPKTDCCKCGKPNDRLPQKYCRVCHAANMRATRPAHRDLSESAKRAATARAYANVYQRRGKLVPCCCEVCNSTAAQKHHEDYAKPLDVHWLCRPCHLAEHARTRNMAAGN